VLRVHSESSVQISVQFTSSCVARVVVEKRAVVCACVSVTVYTDIDFNCT
jgi:hypothetical protein